MDKEGGNGILCYSTLPIPSPAPHQPPEDLWFYDFMPCICWKQWHWCTIAHKFKHTIFTVAIKTFQLLTHIPFLSLVSVSHVNNFITSILPQISEKSPILQYRPHLLLNLVAISNHLNWSLTQISYKLDCLYYYYGIQFDCLLLFICTFICPTPSPQCKFLGILKSMRYIFCILYHHWTQYRHMEMLKKYLLNEWMHE